MSGFRFERLPGHDPMAGVEEAVESWARAQMAYAPVLGYPRVDSTCRDAVSSRQWDGTTEIMSHQVDGMVVEAVSGAIDSLAGLHRAVLWAVYANLVGPAVWRNGHLAGLDRDRIDDLRYDALVALKPLLRRRGLVL